MVRALAAAVMIVAICPHRAASQTIAGTVVLSDRTTPVPGAVVVATDARGLAARTVSGDSGRFVLRVAQPGRYSLRVLRIGFRPSEAPAIDVRAAGTSRVTLVADGSPVSLAAVAIRASENCRVHPDTGLLVSRVWEEARTAMIAAQVGGAGEPIQASWVEYDRLLDSSGRRVKNQTVRTATHPTTHAFKSVSADSLARYGYVVATSGTIDFFAPDPGVLLSDQFAGAHCFRLVSPPADEQRLIGVQFEPSDQRADIRDITGTIWVDRASSELLSLDFSYTNLPDEAMRAGAGGRVDFLHLTNGVWLVGSWDVRFPILQQAAVVHDAGTRRTIYSVDRLQVQDIQVTGGRVTSVTRGDSTLFERRGPRIAIQLVARDTSIPAAGARISLDGTNYSAVPDALGLAQIESAIDGVYVARIHLPILDSLGIPPLEREVKVHDDSPVDSLSLPTASEIVGRVCTKQSLRDGPAMLHGTVADDRGERVSASKITVGWQALSNGTASAVERTLSIAADTNGDWQACGVPRGVMLTVRVSTTGSSDMRHVQVADDQAWASVNLVVRPMLASTKSAGTPARASLALSVRNTDGAPVPAVVLSIEDEAGESRQVATDAGGSAQVADILPGRISIQARRIGFTPGQVTAMVQPGNDTLPIVLSDIGLPQLDTVRIVAARVSMGRHADFDTRLAQHAAAAAFSRADIEKRNPVDLWQLFSNVPSLRVTQTGSVVTIESARGQILKNEEMVPCPILVAVDGILLNRDGNSVNANQLPAPSDVYGVEVFAGAATVPFQFLYAAGGTVCGLVAIWTR